MNVRFEPVAWMTAVLVALGALIAANHQVHVLPEAWTPWLVVAETALAAVLGVIVRSKVTPLANPKAADGRHLVPSPPARVPHGTPPRSLDATIDDEDTESMARPEPPLKPLPGPLPERLRRPLPGPSAGPPASPLTGPGAPGDPDRPYRWNR